MLIFKDNYKGEFMDLLVTFLGKDSGFGENNNSAYFKLDNKFILIDCRIYNIWKS